MSTPLLLNIKAACERSALGRSSLYLRLNEGSIRSVTVGRRRLIDASSLDAWVASLQPSIPSQSVKGGK